MVSDVIRELGELLTRKGADYGGTAAIDRAAQAAGVDTDTVFRVMLALKLSRITELAAANHEPANEPLEDSLMDLAGYAVLWLEHRRSCGPGSHNAPL